MFAMMSRRSFLLLYLKHNTHSFWTLFWKKRRPETRFSSSAISNGDDGHQKRDSSLKASAEDTRALQDTASRALKLLKETPSTPTLFLLRLYRKKKEPSDAKGVPHTQVRTALSLSLSLVYLNMDLARGESCVLDQEKKRASVSL